MQYSEVKRKMLSFFQDSKLNYNLNEWGFSNEIEKEINVIGYATNLTPEIIEQANSKNINLIVTHHDAWDFLYGMKEKCVELLERYNISHVFFHAPLDDAPFGTSTSLAKALGLKELQPVIKYEEVYFAGIVGKFEKPLSFNDFEKLLSTVLNEPIKAFKNNDSLISTVCITTGGGFLTPFIKEAVDNNCDTYVTGEYVLYSQQYAKFAGINLLTGSHTNTEILGVEKLVKLLVNNTKIEKVRLIEENY